MPFIRKYIYIFCFLIMFLFMTIWEYFRNGNWAILENFFFSLLFVIIYAFANWAWDSKKYEKK